MAKCVSCCDTTSRRKKVPFGLLGNLALVCYTCERFDRMRKAGQCFECCETRRPCDCELEEMRFEREVEMFYGDFD